MQGRAQVSAGKQLDHRLLNRFADTRAASVADGLIQSVCQSVED